MGSHHHHIASKNIFHLEDLRQQFAETGIEDTDGGRDIQGERYHRLLAEMTKIVEHQWRSNWPRGLIKGFMLSGPPGTGKTTLAKRLAYELALRFGGDEKSVALAFIDGAEISRSRYGESEERILDIFMHAKSGFTAVRQRSIVLFDDVESIFMERGSHHAKEWHLSQDSVFFHAMDDLDTSRSIVVLTTNRPDLVDQAIRDRVLTYDIGYPDGAMLEALALDIAEARKFSEEQRKRLQVEIAAAIASNLVRSLRDVQRFVVQHYVSELLGEKSMALL